METILLVDDDPAIREIFSLYLGNEGFDALAVGGGAGCLGMLEHRIPALILLDLMMEPMDGWDTLLGIRNNPEAADVPVIMVTGKYPTYREIARFGGLIEDFLMKPVDFEVIGGSIRGTLERSRDLLAEAGRIQDAGCDPALIHEYLRLHRLVRITRDLVARFRTVHWADHEILRRQEEDLARLHARLGFSDRFLAAARSGTE